jgi:hypothetical protein
MTGGLMQLVAYGAQDIYLTGNPMITYFKVVYRRHTNFAMESIQQTFNGTVGFGRRVTALISRNGDLVNGMTLEVTLPNTVLNDRWTDNVGHFLISQVEVEIGGQLIDRHYSDWLEIWSQLTIPADKKEGYLKMIGQSPLDPIGQPTGFQLVNDARFMPESERKLYIPLQFWFCRNVGLSLPLIALQYHEVKVNLTFNSYANLAGTATLTAAADGLTALSASLWVDYIYLDTDERRRFAQVSHEYLIEQLQFNGNESVNVGATVSSSITLNFNHPVKELVWVFHSNAFRNINNYLAVDGVAAVPNAAQSLIGKNLSAIRGENYVTGVAGTLSPFNSANLQLNGQDRFASRSAEYFNQVQTNEHHTCVPESPGINVYSFALKPEEHQPSGTCNFSRIDNAKLQFTARAAMNGVVKVFATNYNVLRVMSGMGGLAYSN